MKKCNRCKKELDTSSFWRSRRSIDGLNNWCKSCWYENDKKKKGTPKYREQKHRSEIKYMYGISYEQYGDMLSRQNGVCAICQTTSDTNLCVDHDHSCCVGKKSCGNCVRGLLCHNCNRALGLFGDRIDLLHSAAQYLKANME
jgi:hypothetical protein